MSTEKRQILARALAAPLSMLWIGTAWIAAPASPAGAQVPNWETAANHAGDPRYVQMPYEVVFVAAKIVETPTTGCGSAPVPLGQYDIGTDVLRATRPSAGNSLWVVTRNGNVKKLFPLPIHETTRALNPETGQQGPLIDTPLGMLDKGSVVEPNVSEDGTRVIFAYFHDATFNIPGQEGGMSRHGADLYVLNMAALIADPTVDPATLPVRRLTFRAYDTNGDQADADKNKNAMNQAVVNIGNNGWGTVYMHGTEMRTADGLKLVYVSGEKRLQNSNDERDKTNYNLNLNIADINANGSLGAKRQFQYYTTTAALSPTPLPEGIAFSYQATTGDGRNWQIQRIDSVGRWAPLIGYGSNPDLFHLGAYCVSTETDSHGNPPGDYFVATRYYNQNNNGFGSLWKINLAETGINTYDDVTPEGVKPKQKNARRLSLFVADGDDPAWQNTSGQWYGKLTTPRCGRPDELFFSHTPTSANNRLCASDGKGIYHAYIAFRSGFEDFNPLATWTPSTNDGLRVLVDDGNDAYSLVWPVPLLSWQARTGNAQQAFTSSVIDPNARILPGQPYATVGTSAIYNTDRRPYDCWLRAGGVPQPYDPNQNSPTNPHGLSNNQRDQIIGSFDGVTKVLQTNGVPDFCKPLSKADVLGIEVNITSNKINHLCCSLGYETDGAPRNDIDAGTNETVRQLGVYDVRSQTDGSFKAMIPSHVPFELHLLDVKYGLRLVDVRSWHSLQPRETRTNCGGCHQHVAGQGIPFAGTVASTQRALDMVTQTQTVTYDGGCNPVLVTTPNATEKLPEWKQDIWTKFDTYCSSCHTGTGSGTAAFAYTAGDERNAYKTLMNKNYADTISGALGSPAFWAARGERTDGRDNALYATSPSYHFSTIHSTSPGLCAQNDPVKAEWVHKLGQWIDNHMPRTTAGNFPADKDTYHPTVDGAIYDNLCAGASLRVGFWDDSGSVQSVQVLKNGVSIGGPWGPLPNGFQNLTGLSIADADVIKVIVEDADNNRQWYEKTGRQLKNDCQVTIHTAQAMPLP
ncbi:MAG: hypothetical protein QOF89_5807 [Acidobacteriota bacterium]|jgi:mono/diheme cytochrome c family protein|nr:hypothetical protein [Acidobacteriota bacterium]